MHSNSKRDDSFERVESKPLNQSYDEEKSGASLQCENSQAMEDMSWMQSFWLACKRSTPTILTMVFFQLVQLLNIYFAGHKSSELLAGIGLGNMLLNVLVFAFTMGLNGTIETFVSWSFGAGDNKMCGTHLNRARVVVSLLMVPVMFVFFFIDKILISMQQDAEIAVIARNYCVWTIPGWFCSVHFDSTKRFMQTIHWSVVSTTTQCITTALHFGWGYLFIVYLDLGVAGAALALNLTYCLNFLSQELFIHVIKRQYFEAYLQPFFTVNSLDWKGAKEFLKLGIPGTMMQCAEWWAFELLAIFAGILGKHQLAAQVAVINIIGLCYMIPCGV